MGRLDRVPLGGKGPGEDTVAVRRRQTGLEQLGREPGRPDTVVDIVLTDLTVYHAGRNHRTAIGKIVRPKDGEPKPTE